VPLTVRRAQYAQISKLSFYSIFSMACRRNYGRSASRASLSLARSASRSSRQRAVCRRGLAQAKIAKRLQQRGDLGRQVAVAGAEWAKTVSDVRVAVRDFADRPGRAYAANKTSQPARSPRARLRASLRRTAMMACRSISVRARGEAVCENPIRAIYGSIAPCEQVLRPSDACYFFRGQQAF
jgi:hypothetical protein